MWQYRVRRSAYRLASWTHGDDVKVECASSIALASHATCTRLDPLQSKQQLRRLGFHRTGSRGEVGNRIDVEGLVGWGKRFRFVPS